MGKTAAGAVWLDPGLTAPYDYYQFWINTDDRDVERFLGLFTLLEMEDVRELGRLRGAEIRRAKQRLAFEATGLAHGEKAAHKAAEAASNLFGREGGTAGASRNAPTTHIPFEEFGEGLEAHDLFHRVGLVKSRGEARRLIEGGGAYVNGEKVSAFNNRVLPRQAREGVITLRAGKKKYHLLRVEEEGR